MAIFTCFIRCSLFYKLPCDIRVALRVSVCLWEGEGQSGSGHNEPEKTPQVWPQQVTAVVGPVTGSGKDLLECSALCTEKTHKLSVLIAHLNLVVLPFVKQLCTNLEKKWKVFFFSSNFEELKCFSTFKNGCWSFHFPPSGKVHKLITGTFVSVRNLCHQWTGRPECLSGCAGHLYKGQMQSRQL